VALLHFPHWPRRIGSVGTGGAGREQVELGSSLKHERRVQEGREPRVKNVAGNRRVVATVWRCYVGLGCLLRLGKPLCV
jgi:hypothetical protein